MRTRNTILSRGALLGAMFVAAILPSLLCAQELQSHWDGDRLHVSAPSLHFLTGKALDRLHNGAAVAFDVELSINSDGNLLSRAQERFVISYDLWEERFSVTRLARDGIARLSVSHLTQEAAEVWCLDNVSLATEGIAPGRPVRIRLDLRAEEPREPDRVFGEDGISVGAIVEILSRRTPEEQQRWNLERGPLRLSEVRPNGTE